MKIETVPLSLVKVNDKNPREIKNDKFDKLVDSLLVFPGMLDLRPVVVDKDFVALGGNMRTQALNYISTLDASVLFDRLENVKDYERLKKDERENLLQFWTAWLGDPVCQIIKAETLTESERRQFIIKDNASFGSWDFDALANEWADCPLQDWGVDVWDSTTSQGASENKDAGADVNPDEYGTDFTLPSGDKSPFVGKTFTLSAEQSKTVEDAIKEAKTDPEFDFLETFGNENGNGNALYLIVKQWAEQRK